MINSSNIAEALPLLRHPQAEPDLKRRSLHLVDVENLLGSTDFTEAEVAGVAAAYRRLAGLAPTDLVVIASSHYTAYPTWFGWRTARRLVRSGPNGADLALMQVIETENVAARFDRVVIASGDGIFALPAARLQQAGLTVSVVSRREFLSRQLRFAVRDVRYLDLTPDLEPVATLRSIV